MLAWLIARFAERSTWGAVITATGTLAGVAVKPDYAEAIGVIGTLAAATIAAATVEAPRAKKGRRS